jgi:hypothetical protein
MDVQSVCEVQNILALVRQSINSAQPMATISSSGRIDVGVPLQIVTLRAATAADQAQYPDVTRLRLRVRSLPNPQQILELAQRIAPTLSASASPYVMALLKRYPSWQTNPIIARGVLLRILDGDDPGPLEQWRNALDATEKAAK